MLSCLRDSTLLRPEPLPRAVRRLSAPSRSPIGRARLPCRGTGHSSGSRQRLRERWEPTTTVLRRSPLRPRSLGAASARLSPPCPSFFRHRAEARWSSWYRLRCNGRTNRTHAPIHLQAHGKCGGGKDEVYQNDTPVTLHF